MNTEEEQRLLATLNESWYLREYPDVTSAKFSALEHFENHGIREHRWPCKNSAPKLERVLWETLGDETILYTLDIESKGKGLNASWSCLVLARWFHSQGNINSALLYVRRFFELGAFEFWKSDLSPYLIAMNLYVAVGNTEAARKVLLSPYFKHSNDKILAESMLLEGKEQLTKLNKVYKLTNIVGSLSTIDKNTPVSLDNIQVKQLPFSKKIKVSTSDPKVSIIIPLFNSEQTIDTAIRSLLAQTWKNIEVIIVDDCSTDQSTRRVKQWQKSDYRIKLLQKDRNAGAYSARNDGLEIATGDFITTHDADDWSHSDKIRQQVLPLIDNQRLMATVSHWVRCTESFLFNHWRIHGEWIYRNVSSLMFRRKVYEELGYWDRVKVNGDTEFYYRLLAAYGNDSVKEVFPGVPLAFGRMQSNSLSQSNETHLRTQYRGVRKQYHEAAQRWHSEAEIHELYIEKEPISRKFPAPETILRATKQQHFHNRELLVRHSGYFDADWYALAYKDLPGKVNELFKHYYESGEQELRDPNPLFSVSGYKYAYRLPAHEQVLIHAINTDFTKGRLIEVTGNVNAIENALNVALFAHWVSAYSFGAERSFLDVLCALRKTRRFNMTVFLPSATNHNYVDEIRKVVSKVIFLPTIWWSKGRKALMTQVDSLQDYFAKECIELCYVNTCVLYEPVLAAKQLKIPTLMHVRELPEYDQDLCQRLAASSDEIREHLLSLADEFIVNSIAVKEWLKPSCSKYRKIPNVSDINPAEFMGIRSEGRLRVGIASSNVEKKGIADFIELAEKAKAESLNAQFIIYGPETGYLQNLLARFNSSDVVTYAGYRESPSEVMREVDVIVSFSLFKESFGRTVLEAFLAGKGVIAYDWGGVREVFSEQVEGLIKYRDVNSALAILRKWVLEREHLKRIASGNQLHAIETFNKKRFEDSLKSAFSSAISKTKE